MTFIVNLHGAPGSGKSTTRAGLFYRLKLAGYNVEEVTEYAKDLTWEDRHFALQCQPYVFAKQLRNLERVLSKVEAVITDSPLLLSYFYAKKYNSNKYPESFYDYVIDQVRALPSVNYFMNRDKDYNPAGRNQTEAESDEIAIELKQLIIDKKLKVYDLYSLDTIFKEVSTMIDTNRKLVQYISD